jgi:hypothetical protein
MSDIPFVEWPKIPRLSRNCIVTEKIDGTNASIFVGESGEFLTGSRTQWIAPEKDNYGFAKWAQEHKEELLNLGPGHHFGEWWGSGIQRRYGVAEKRFSLFNTARWRDAVDRPACCGVVPVLYAGPFDTLQIDTVIRCLETGGSAAAPGFMDPEGVIVWHDAARMMFKKTIKKDAEHKGRPA